MTSPIGNENGREISKFTFTEEGESPWLQQGKRRSQSKKGKIGPTSDKVTKEFRTLNLNHQGKATIGHQNLIERTVTAKTPHPVQVIRQAHQDDIHGFLSISSSHFVSGSKDCTLKMWSVDGSFIKELIPEVAKAQRGYKYWITSLAKFNDNWISGTRDGQITFWDPDGEEQLAFHYSPSHKEKDQYICKNRNKARINCLTSIPSDEEERFFYAGTPKFVHLCDSKTQKIVQSFQASENDWVYCVEVLENKDLLVVIGSDLEYWDMSCLKPTKTSLIQEEADRRRVQRPHISAITRLEENKNLLSAALFDGSVKVVDIAAQTLVRTYKEHQGRVWSMINLTPSLFASSADDRTINIWDIRQNYSVKSFVGGPGRVSSLLRISEEQFISGSCPDNVFESTEKASISFWDIRQLA